MESVEKMKVWFVPVTKEQWIIRLGACFLSWVFILLYLGYMNVGYSSSITFILVIGLVVFYTVLDVIEYLQTGHVVWRKMGPNYPVSGNLAKFQVGVDLIVIIFIICSPFILK